LADHPAMARMHAGEVETDVALVRRLLAGQFPRWAGLPIEPVESYGTDHDIYRLGDHLAARLPRIGWATAQADTEARWLPRLGPQLPLALPVQLARGHPAEGYPFEWSVYEWLPGENANGTIGDLEQAALDLAGFVRALRRVDTTGAHPRHPHGRGGPLSQSATRPATCSRPGTCSPGPAGPGSGPSSRSTTRPGCGAAAGPWPRR
jgi:aminoglycoside phosphotransferase (APT) family kinase protein